MSILHGAFVKVVVVQYLTLENMFDCVCSLRLGPLKYGRRVNY